MLPDSQDFLKRSPVECGDPLKNGHCLEWDRCKNGVIYPFVPLPNHDSRLGFEVVGGDVPFPGCDESSELPSNNWIRLIVSVKGD